MTEEEIIKKYEPLIYKVAKKFYNVETCDLYQAGIIGLIKAYRKYDKSISDNFINFAYMQIFGEMYNLSINSRDIRLNKKYLQLSKQIEKARNSLYDKLNRYPSNLELSLFLEIDEEIINDVTILTSKILSLNEKYDSYDGNSLCIEDCIGSYDDPVNQILIKDSLSTLTDLEQEVIKERYFNDLTQDETAKVLGISQVKVSRVEQKGKQKIKEYIAV